jgi:N-acetylglutamate synthase/N-acetylornithine aminotransferase
MSDKITIENLCGGQFKEQVEAALKKLAANIEKYGNTAEHEFTVKVTACENADYGVWEMDAKTSVSCKTHERMISSKEPVKISKGAIYDGNPQQKLALG